MELRPPYRRCDRQSRMWPAVATGFAVAAAGGAGPVTDAVRVFGLNLAYYRCRRGFESGADGWHVSFRRWPTRQGGASMTKPHIVVGSRRPNRISPGPSTSPEPQAPQADLAVGLQGPRWAGPGSSRRGARRGARADRPGRCSARYAAGNRARSRTAGSHPAAACRRGDRGCRLARLRLCVAAGVEPARGIERSGAHGRVDGVAADVGRPGARERVEEAIGAGAGRRRIGIEAAP